MSISVGESGNILMSFMSSLMCAECIISCCLSKSNYYTHWVWESKWKANLCCSSMYLSLAPLFLSIAHKYILWKNRLMKFIIHIRMSKTVKTKIKCQKTNQLNRMQTTAAPATTATCKSKCKYQHTRYVKWKKYQNVLKTDKLSTVKVI